jgi:hypothetical protein
VLWLDAAEYSTLTFSGSNVTQWNDKSGNGNNATTTTTARRPTYSTTALNTSYPGLVFTSSVLNPGFTGSIPNSTVMFFPNCQGGTNTASYFAVWQATDTSRRCIFNNYKNMYSLYYGIWTDFLQTNASTTFVNQQVTYTATTNPRIAGFTMTPGSTNVLVGSLNGTTTTVTTANPNLPSSTTDENTVGCIGAYYEDSPKPTYYEATFSGSISELLIYTQALSTSDRQAVEGYLANKWGLVSSLPASHPYKKFRN